MNREWGIGSGEQGKAGARFLQSASDFPLLVSLGKKSPSWGLSRWNGGGLRFVPPDDEGFTLRGEKKRLVYKGRRRSHRFTILGNSAFEYDCILEKEPESNVVSLRMEGAEKFVFFRQPDFLSDPLLAGSYAVYKKETLLGEGTGKLCHIHRPEIIDARGRRCWGELAIVGNELRITTPETFLSEAVYPVIVDPTIGTTTVGSQELWYDPDNHDEDDELNWRPLWFEVNIPVNKFAVSQAISGNCLAYIYVNDGSGNDNRPVIYSDNGNKPLNRLTKNEAAFDSTVSRNNPKGWRSASFAVTESIPSGSNIWFGVFSDYWEARFDYGQFIIVEDYDWQNTSAIPNVYPQEHLNWYATHPQQVAQSYNFKVSWYFTYSSAQNYIRTLTQGVTLTDSRKLAANYNHIAAQTVKGTTALEKLAAYLRAIPEITAATDTIQQWRAYFRGIVTEAASVAETSYGGMYYRSMAETVQAHGAVFRGLLIFVKILTVSLIRDFILRRFLKSNEDLVLKSCVCREITLDSTIH